MKKLKNGELILNKSFGSYLQAMLDFMLNKMSNVKAMATLKNEITKQNLNDVWEMEMELPMLINTRRAGIRVDEERADLLKRNLKVKKMKY